MPLAGWRGAEPLPVGDFRAAARSDPHAPFAESPIPPKQPTQPQRNPSPLTTNPHSGEEPSRFSPLLVGETKRLRRRFASSASIYPDQRRFPNDRNPVPRCVHPLRTVHRPLPAAAPKRPDPRVAGRIPRPAADDVAARAAGLCGGLHGESPPAGAHPFVRTDHGLLFPPG